MAIQQRKALPYAPYYINDKSGVVVPYHESFANSRYLRPMNAIEMRERGLPVPDDASVIAASLIELPPGIDDMDRSELNEFVTSNNLATSLNISLRREQLVHQVKVLVAERRKQIIDATRHEIKMPREFYTLTLFQLKQYCEAKSLDTIDFTQEKSEIQRSIAKAMADRNEEIKMSDVPEEDISDLF